MNRIAFIFMLALFLAPAALSCPDNQRILRISGPTNAHAELYDGTNYATEICYDTIFGPYVGAAPHACNGANGVLQLSALTNAHVEMYGLPNYPEQVCFGGLVCDFVGPDAFGVPRPCTVFDPAAQCLATVPAVTNAHISSLCSGAGSYPMKVCCKLALAPNVVPVANAGGNQATLSGVSVSLNGSCTDSDGIIPDCDWGSAPAGCSFAGAQSKAGLGTANASSAVDVSCIGAVGASFTLTLTATDNFADTGSDAMLVTILAPAGSGSYLRLTKIDVAPENFSGGAPPDFTTLDVTVKNFGDPTDASIGIKVFWATDFSMVDGTEFASAQANCGSLGTGVDCTKSLETINVSSLAPGSYKLVIKAYADGVEQDSESVFFVVIGPVPVPELGLVFIPLLAVSALAIMFFAGRSGKAKK